MNNKFASCLWMRDHVQEAAEFYQAIFERSKQRNTLYYVDSLHGKAGDILTISLELAGTEFILLNGGPEFSPTPAVSYLVTCSSENQLRTLWSQLSQDGEILMALEEFPEVGLFGWTNDRYGFSWQLRLGAEELQTITPCLLFANELDGKAAEAVDSWIAAFGSNGQLLFHSDDTRGHWQIAEFTLADQHFYIMESDIPHDFGFSMANSFYVYCEDQAEIDAYWAALTKHGQEFPCGWAMDAYGISWQIATRDMDQLFDAKEFNKAYQTTQAMYDMKKIDINELRKVHAAAD